MLTGRARARPLHTLALALVCAAAAAQPPIAAEIAPAAGTSFELFELNPKTSIPERDLTDRHYFHSSAIVRATTVRSAPQIERLLANAANFSAPARGQVIGRDGMYGLRYTARSGKKVDVLFSHFDRPPFVELANRGFLAIRPEANAKLEKLLASALRGVPKRRLPRCASCLATSADDPPGRAACRSADHAAGLAPSPPRNKYANN